VNSLEEWEASLILREARRRHRVVCVTMPFLQLPGPFAWVFPAADLAFLQLSPRRGALAPRLISRGRELDVPFLWCHLNLVRDYWKAGGWQPWRWLEDDFATLRQEGLPVTPGNLGVYERAIRCAAVDLMTALEGLLRRSSAEALAVYGRGHWTSNVAAVLAHAHAVPLYVIEPGLMPGSLIVDREQPYTAPFSQFRRAWKRFREIGAPCAARLTPTPWPSTSVWDDTDTPPEVGLEGVTVLVGQCSFDVSLADAPFNDPVSFVRFILGHLKGASGRIVYRPHPLSPEIYPDGVITVDGRRIAVRRRMHKLAALRPRLCTWSSTMGVAGRLGYSLHVTAFDPQCVYADILDDDSALAPYRLFLSKASVLPHAGIGEYYVDGTSPIADHR
jgi:hypothetical protein